MESWESELVKKDDQVGLQISKENRKVSELLRG